MSTSTPKRAAIAQLCSTSNKFQNLVNIAKCAGMARQEGACMLFLPECFGFIGMSSTETLENAEPSIETNSRKETRNEEQVQDTLKRIIQSPSCSDEETLSVSPCSKVFLLDGLKTIARASGLWISAGGMHESGAPSNVKGQDRVYNSHVILDSEGSVQAVYRKTHLFDVRIPNKVNLRESATTAPGTKLVVCDSPIGRLGITTCYDVRFPEMYIELVQKGGAQVLLVPSAFTVPTGSAHWHVLLRARAIETQCYVLAAAQYGRHNEKRTSYGHSLAVDPWGRILADAGGDDAQKEEPPSIITCDIDLNELESTRQRMPIQQHRDAASFSF